MFNEYNEIKPTPETIEFLEDQLRDEPETDEVEVCPDVIGIVVGCGRLRVREDPFNDAEVLTEIPVGTTVIVNTSEYDEDFFKVTLECGMEGYCMKKFIEIEE